MKEETIKYIYSKYDNSNKSFKRKDSKQTKVILLIKDYFSKNKSLSREKFDEFLIFIDLKSIWSTKEEQNILWKSLLSYSINKTIINYEAAFKGIMDLFKMDDDTKNNSTNNKSMEEIKESFNKYIKSLNGNLELFYDIIFINNIYFSKDNININNKMIEDIINDIKIKYKFVMIKEKEIKNYLSNFKYNINKQIISHINSLIENIIESNKNKIDYNRFNDNINKNDGSASFSTPINETNNYNELFDKLMKLDKNIFDCMDSLIYFYKNKNLIDLSKKYIQNYILITKKNIYNNLKIIIEKGNKKELALSKISALNNENLTNCNSYRNINIDIQNNIVNNNNIINNFNLSKLDNKKSQNLSKKELIYIKKGIKSEKSYNNIFDINKKLNEDNKYSTKNKQYDNSNTCKINTNYNNTNTEQYSGQLILSEKIKYNTNKTDNQEKLLSLNTHKKLKKNISYCNFNKLSQIKEFEPFNLSNRGQNSSRNNFPTEKKGSQTQREDDSLSLEGSIEDLNMFTFNDNVNEQKLLQTANLEHLDECDDIIEKGTPTLNPIDLESKDLYNDDYYDDYFKENYDKKEENNSNIEKLDLSKCKNPNDFTFGKDYDNNEENTCKIKLPGDIDSNIPNYMNNNLISVSNQNYKKFVKIGHYDFKYLYKNNNIKKLFNTNNDKLNPIKFLTDEVFIISNNGLKKQKVILIISEIFYYLLKSNSHMNCISKIKTKSLKSISISSRNCNLVLFIFDKESLIIETFRRMEILKFIKEIITDKSIKINISHNFATKKQGENDTINLKKIKVFSYSPNFENAKKIGILLKYQENFFSAKFHEKLVVLCDLGLLYFDENDKVPKIIIPIIGTTIKFYIVQGSDKIYCFQLKTINEESYIFGSKIKKEIFDWIHEFSIVKKKYFLQLKEIEPNLQIHSKNKKNN